MSSDNVIMIVPSSSNVIDNDVRKIAAAVSYVVDKLSEKQSLGFFVDVLEDVPSSFANGVSCNHVFGIATPQDGEYINFQYSSFIPEVAILKCARCGEEYSLFRSVDEIRQALPPWQRDKVNGVICKRGIK